MSKATSTVYWVLHTNELKNWEASRNLKVEAPVILFSFRKLTISLCIKFPRATKSIEDNPTFEYLSHVFN